MLGRFDKNTGKEVGRQRDGCGIECTALPRGWQRPGVNVKPDWSRQTPSYVHLINFAQSTEQPVNGILLTGLDQGIEGGRCLAQETRRASSWHSRHFERRQ